MKDFLIYLKNYKGMFKLYLLSLAMIIIVQSYKKYDTLILLIFGIVVASVLIIIDVSMCLKLEHNKSEDDDL